MIPRRWAHVLPGEWDRIFKAVPPAEHGTDHTARWEEVIAEATGVPHAAAVSSGRRGMTLIFEHLGLREGDEVIVPAYTLGDLIPLIQQFGAKAVPADIELESLNVSAQAIEQRIGPRTKAILALHAFGMPCGIDQILNLARSRGVPVIEDGAHALGARFKGQPVGSFGYAGFFSFEVTKPVNTFGGGMVVTRDAALAEHIHQRTAHDANNLTSVVQKARSARTEQRLFQSNLAFPFLYLLATPALRNAANRLYRRAQYVPASVNRYAELQAELGLAKWESLAERIAGRARAAELYRSLLRPEIRTQQIPSGGESTWYFFMALLPAPAAPIRKRLLWRGIDAGIEGEIADDTAAMLGYDDCPNARQAYRRAMALPMHDDISEASVERVARALNALIR